MTPSVALACQAMATRFEIVLPGDDAVRLRAAGEEALAEIERLEARLSLYQPASEIARVNARAALGPVRVSPEVFRLLADGLDRGELWDEPNFLHPAQSRSHEAVGYLRGTGQRL